MKPLFFLTTLTLLAAPNKPVKLQTVPATVTLTGAGASQQFLATATYPDGTQADVTADVKWTAKNASLQANRATAITDGPATVEAEFDGLRAKSQITVKGATTQRPFAFARDIGSILTKRGCNSSACHGGVKGRGGLKLSANALFPKDDYEWITKGGVYQVLSAEVKGERVPRINAADPEKSLLLQKPLMQIPHGGGKKLEKDSEDYRAILNWVKSGAPYGVEGSTATLASLEVYPPIATLPVASAQRLLVTAKFSDGHTEDYSNQVLFSTNNGDVATVTPDGIVKGKGLGETAILIRAAGFLASAPVAVIGPTIANYPAVPRANFIDDAIFSKLRKVNILPSDIASDAEFLRRVCLDLTGTLPPSERVREFLALRDPKKREKLVDALIASPEFIDYWTFRFSDIFRVAIFANGLTPKFSQKYWEWIRDNIATNRPYDEVARERLCPGLRRRLPPLHPLQPNRPARRRHGGRGSRLLRPPSRLRPVPQPPLRKLEPGSVLGHGRLLRPPLQSRSRRLRSPDEHGLELQRRRRQNRNHPPAHEGQRQTRPPRRLPAGSQRRRQPPQGACPLDDRPPLLR